MAYPRPKNDSGIGWHMSPNGDYPMGRSDALIDATLKNMNDCGVTWAKVVLTPPYGVPDSNGNASKWQNLPIERMIEAGIEVIVRLFTDKPYPGYTTNYDEVRNAVKYWVGKGVHYFELRNEPNLLVEWESQEAWDKVGGLRGRAERAAAQFVEDAKAIQREGGIALTPALSPGGNDDSEYVWPAMCEWWRDHTTRSFWDKAAVASHGYMLNHPINYPYDKINQEGDNPGQTLMSGQGASNGFLHFRYLAHVFYNYMGFTVPVLSTEDGARWGDADDNRYPPMVGEQHTNAHLQVGDYMANEAEDGYFCTAFWLLGSRLFEAHGSPPPWEQHAWISPYGSDLPGRPGVELPVLDAFRHRGYVPRKHGKEWGFVTESPPGIKWEDISGQLPKSERLPPYEERPLDDIDLVLIHHTAANPNLTAEQIARYHISPPSPEEPDKEEMPGIAYHFYIVPDGTIYRTQPDRMITWHAGKYTVNEHSLAVAFAGDFTQYNPTYEQVTSGKLLVKYLLERYELGDADIQPHYYVVDTACPGSEWWLMLRDESQHPLPDDEKAEIAIRKRAWGYRNIPLNEDSAFYKEANELGLGAPFSRENDMNVDGQWWRWQSYANGILYCKIYKDADGEVTSGDWDDMKMAGW